jgi:D-alanyl-D-alanine carboxypeptidase
MNGQQRPVNGQQRPVQGQRRPINTQRGPSGSYLSTKKLLSFAILVTAILIVISILIGAFALIFSGVFDGIFDKKENNVTDNADKDNPAKPSKPSQDTGNEDDKSIVKSSINLPSSTPSGTYLSGYSSSADTISGISSAAAVLVDVGANSVTASKNADTKIYPASMTKVMTLLVACENASVAGKLLTVEQWMIDYQQRMGASGIMGFKAGEQISLEDALYLINYNSDTIACLLVANYVSGSEAEFVKLMNKKARELGLTNTHFTNTTGLHDADHYTTCREMAAIMNCAMKNPVASKIISAHSGRGIAVYNNNKASRSATVYAAWYSDDGRFNDDARVAGTKGNMTVIGGKTGYEDIPTACFVTIAEHKNGSKYICVTVGRTVENQATVSPEKSTTDTETIYREYAYKK